MSLKVLVVEDDTASLELMREVLASADAEVRAVSDSEVAAALINKENFDGISFGAADAKDKWCADADILAGIRVLLTTFF